MKHLVGIGVGILLLVGVVLGGSLYWDAHVISPEENASSVELTIEPGSSVSQIAEQLQEQEIISSSFFFKAYVKLAKKAGSLQAGSFTLQQGENFSTLVSQLTNATTAEVQITIPEGYTLVQIEEVVLKRIPGISQESWRAAVDGRSREYLTDSQLVSDIPAGYDFEGYLFPDTYRFHADATAEQVVDTLMLTLKRRLSEQGIVVPNDLVMSNGMSFHDVLTLASIVEREVRSADEMSTVAGIFHTRLKIGMALQADSTVNYVTGKNDPGVTLKDSKVQSPYNTYQNAGLPPGPISNPGVQAIQAVLEPAQTNYLYFLTDAQGKVYYAETFAEHVDNKYRYLK